MDIDSLAHDLLLLMINLSQLKSEDRILTIFLEAINNLSPRVTLRLGKDATVSTIETIPIATSRRSFGYITIEKKSEEDLPEKSLALIRNAIQMLAIVLENRLQTQLLADENIKLERMVQDRTAELVAANKSLKQKIAELTQTEETLRQHERQLSQVTANIPGFVYQFLFKKDGSQFMPYASERAEELFGVPAAEIQGDASKVFSLIPSTDSEKIRRAIERSAETLTEYQIDHRVRKSEDEMLWLRVKSTPEVLDNGDILWNGVGIDITKQKQAEEKIRASLREKEALLREIHHRVKNNLQVICALLDLQADSVDDVQIREVFEESRNRVRSMAQIHEQLTYNENLAQIDMEAYIQELVSSLRVAYGREDIAINIDVSDVTLPFDLVSPCGLLINELVSNAIKHAFPVNSRFPQDRIKTISIKLQKRASTVKILELTVADNGIGLPEGIDPASPFSLGLTLVNLLVNQLRAALKLDRQAGTAYKIQFSP